MSQPSILIAGIGNIFMGDDAFGSEVARQLLMFPWPENVRVEDFGIRGLDLAYALADTCDIAILIDATQYGGLPGTLHLIEPEMDFAADEQASMFDAHSMDPVKVLRLVATLGNRLQKVLLVGCEPAHLGDEEVDCTELSDAVRGAVPQAISMIQALVDELCERGHEQKLVATRKGDQPS